MWGQWLSWACFVSWQWQKDEKGDLKLVHHHFCLTLLDKAITWLNPESRSTLCLSMAKGTDTRNDEVLCSLLPCTTVAKRYCFPSFTRISYHCSTPWSGPGPMWWHQTHGRAQGVGKEREMECFLLSVTVWEMDVCNPESFRKLNEMIFTYGPLLSRNSISIRVGIGMNLSESH